MTTELTKAAQQALEALKHGVAQLNGIGIPLEADPLHTAIIALRAALTQRPAAQEVTSAHITWDDEGRRMLNGRLAPEHATISDCDRVCWVADGMEAIGTVVRRHANDSDMVLVEIVSGRHWVHISRVHPMKTKQDAPDHAAEIARLKAVIDQLERREILAVAQQATPAEEFKRINCQVNGIAGTVEARRVDENTVDHGRVVAFEDEQATPEPVGEPFGYFRALPFEWEQCGEHDEGAVALYTRPAPGVPEVRGVQWFAVAEHGLPDFDEEVIGGLWYTDPWLKPELATRFLWGLCRVLKDEHRDFNGGKRWQTFGPSHNQITHWARLNMPALAAAQAKGGA